MSRSDELYTHLWLIRLIGVALMACYLPACLVA